VQAGYPSTAASRSGAQSLGFVRGVADPATWGDVSSRCNLSGFMALGS